MKLFQGCKGVWGWRNFKWAQELGEVVRNKAHPTHQVYWNLRIENYNSSFSIFTYPPFKSLGYWILIEFQKGRNWNFLLELTMQYDEFTEIERFIKIQHEIIPWFEFSGLTFQSIWKYEFIIYRKMIFQLWFFYYYFE